MIPSICEVPNALNNLSMLELLIKISINIDFTKGLHYDAIFKALEFAMLRPEEEKATPEAIGAQKARRKHNCRNAKNNVKKRRSETRTRLVRLQRRRRPVDHSRPPQPELPGLTSTGSCSTAQGGKATRPTAEPIASPPESASGPPGRPSWPHGQSPTGPAGPMVSCLTAKPSAAAPAPLAPWSVA